MEAEITDMEKDYIKKLKDCKSALNEWARGYRSSGEISDLRSYINQNTPYVRKLVNRAGCGKLMTIQPPAAIGGLILRDLDPFNCVFEAPYGIDMRGVICDMIDGTIGVIQSGELPDETDTLSRTLRTVQSNSKVFVVHGHDEEAKVSVTRFLEKLGLTPIILHEQRNAGQTIIEKFENNSDVAFSVVLMTPDDTGFAKNKDEEAKSRARQNVIFELGYFMAKLGRENVCALVRGDIERPSDYDGIIYIGLDPTDGWKLLLTKEMREAGLDVDLNRAID